MNSQPIQHYSCVGYKSTEPPFKKLNIINVRLNNKRHTVSLSEVAYLESDANYTIFHFKSGKKSISSFTMKILISRAGDLDFFYRINRKIYLNIKLIHTIQPYKVTLKNGTEFIVSRRRYKSLIEFCNNHGSTF